MVFLLIQKFFLTKLKHVSSKIDKPSTQPPNRGRQTDQTTICMEKIPSQKANRY